MKRGPELSGQVVARERGRTRVRAVTITAGAAGLAAAGVIAVNLPAAHSKTVSGTQTANTAPSTSPTHIGYRGDDGEDGFASAPRSSSGSSGGGSHATSGGS